MMKPFFRAAILAAAFTVMAGGARAQIVSLQNEISVDGASVTLGDLFTGLAPDTAATVIANAPRPGGKFVYDARTLAGVAQRYGIAWTPQSQTDRVVLTRTTNLVAIDDVRAALKNALAGEVPAERFTVSLDQARIAIALPSDVAPSLRIENLTYTRTDRRFEADLLAAADTPSAVRTRVSGVVSALVEIPVLNRRMQTGDVISQADLDWVEVDSRTLRADSATEAAQLIGMTPRRALLADQPINLRTLQAPVLVTKGALVTMRLSKANLQLSAQGRALSNGGKGDLIRIQNLSSNRIVEAIVDATDSVIVPVAPTTTASAAASPTLTQETP
jgi:flagella basal body P-ring formation protein FlgA